MKAQIKILFQESYPQRQIAQKLKISWLIIFITKAIKNWFKCWQKNAGVQNVKTWLLKAKDIE